jgi:hypothetical protein
MTDWLSQTQAGVDRWLEVQRQWWDTVLGGGGPAATDDLQRRTVEAWRQAAYKVVDAQAEMLLGAVREKATTDAEAMVRQWTDAQRQMWQGWLAAASPPPAGAQPTADLGAAGQQMVDSLREAAERLVESQAEWAKAWSAAQPKPPARDVSS